MENAPRDMGEVRISNRVGRYDIYGAAHFGVRD
jgi:hypothetical protein